LFADESPMTDEEAWTAVDLAREADFAVGGLRIRPPAREVEADAAGKATLEPRVMQVFVTLARQAGSVVSRDELIARCWAGRVVGDDAIHRCIARLRRLADSHGGFAIETVPKIGYRLQPNEPAAVPTASAPPARVARPRLRIALGAAAALAAVALAGWMWHAGGLERAEQQRTVAQIVAFAEADLYAEAFRLALPLVRAGHLEDHGALREAWQDIALPMKPLVAEDDATVYMKGYAEANAEWIELGVTPFARPVPAPRGTLRFKVTKPGFRTAYFAVANPGPSVASEPPERFIVANVVPIPLPLVPLGSVPDDMVVVPRTDIPVWVPGWTEEGLNPPPREIPEFLIGRTEVTNREFKEFIDAGGYENAAYWDGLAFQDDGQNLSWADAREKFVDSTHRPGPAEWQLSTYPAGQDAYPVGGISWYEAIAYARYRGNTLPTIHHWARAALAPFDPRYNVAPAIARSSNFSAAGPVAADADIGLGPWGTLQMAGNVREWLSTYAGSNALAPGGGWTDYALGNWGIYPIAPMNRSPENGVRLMQTPTDAALLAELREPIRSITDGDRRPIAPASDDAYAAMRMQFDQGHLEPADVSVSAIQETPLAIVEEVILTFADVEPLTLYVTSPRAAAKPLQPIVFAPAGNCCFMKRPDRDALEDLQGVAGFVVDGGRALIMPVWSGSFERFLPAETDAQRTADRERERALAWYREMRIVLDYLATRPDIDLERAGFLGASSGAFGQSIALALEPRLKAAVLISGGISRFQNPHPMADIMNYAPRITMPVLMINGRTDHLLPYAASQLPLLELLGSPAKAHIVYDGGHYQYRRNSVARNVTDWFDRYLGSVR
jgi:formylglycine-generating enzyme required for sulfatase activity/DNA-binding winged helix-turn-helix (wHTH) protein/dienelactone hydrolase